MSTKKSTMQTVWGALLILAGLGVFYRIPQVMAKLEGVGRFSSESFFIRFCFYLMGVMLIGGGGRKIYSNAKSMRQGTAKTPPHDL